MGEEWENAMETASETHNTEKTVHDDSSEDDLEVSHCLHVPTQLEDDLNEKIFV